ncbi:MAG: cell division protein ZapB [Deltaproteobacteria bacterium]|nr:cell division protein ZapB [Deltaproteobacteria bacterium]MBI3754574.1 cell division protein ZapB [Deltaproteobacteria bacterium]
MELGMFEQLEKKVEKIIEKCDELTNENERLTGMLKSKDEKIDNLTHKLEKLGKEKGLVKEKVETLLERLGGLIQTT